MILANLPSLLWFSSTELQKKKKGRCSPVLHPPGSPSGDITVRHVWKRLHFLQLTHCSCSRSHARNMSCMQWWALGRVKIHFEVFVGAAVCWRASLHPSCECWCLWFGALATLILSLLMSNPSCSWTEKEGVQLDCKHFQHLETMLNHLWG